jgi:hypothetical protein
MVPEIDVRQRGLVERQVLFADSQIGTRHIFPFVDRRWRIPFVVLDLSEGRPMVLEGPFRQDQFRFRTYSRAADLRAIESIPIDDLRELVHFDPWWVFRRASGIQWAWAEAIFATNIAHPFRAFGRTWKIRDLVFCSRLDRLQEIQARSPILRSRRFRVGDLDLLSLHQGSRR